LIVVFGLLFILCGMSIERFPLITMLEFKMRMNSSQPYSRRWLLLLVIVLMPCLTACPESIEKMVDDMVPPKGYKPSYTTSSTSLKKITEQLANRSTTTTTATAALGTSATVSASTGGGLTAPFEARFDPSTLMSFPYSPDSQGQTVNFFKTVTNSSLGTVFAGSTSGLVSGLPNIGDDYKQSTIGTVLSDEIMTNLPRDAERGLQRVLLRRADDSLKAYELRMQSAFESVVAAEERDAQRIAAAEPLVPIIVQIRSINDKRYPNEIEVNVSVTDTLGRFIGGLAPPNFQGTGGDAGASGNPNAYRAYWRALADSCSGNPSFGNRVRSFDVQEIREAVRDTHAIAFVLDHSPSMGNARALRLQEAVARTMGIVKRQDFISVVKFTKRIKIEVPLTNDTNAYRRGFLLDGLEGYGSGTAMYDGVLAGIRELETAPKSAQKVVILFCDGDDNSSKSRITDVYRAAKAAGVRIYTIAYGMTEETPLQNLSAATGGTMYRLFTVREFPLAFADLYKALKNYYRIRYRPPECASLHTVSVRLVVPEFVSVGASTGQYDRSMFTQYDEIGSVQMVNVEFESGKATIRPASLPQLRDVATYLQRTPKTVIEIRGHTDDRGTTEINQKLSEARAKAVQSELIGMGASPSQLRSVGFGESKPLAPNDSEDNRRRNRRTELAIVAK
jgi:outer membrane protein OmpA-like peptidoglycan-associated protein/Mg-chelatase subunit ChlD